MPGLLHSVSRCLALGLALAGGLGARAQVPAATVPSPLSVEQVAPGVYLHSGKLEDWGRGNGGDVANLGFIVGQRCVAVVDTGGSPAVGEALKAAIARHTRLPVCWVINTHAHPDHVLGNSAWLDQRPAPQFVAHARFQAALAVRGPHFRNALYRDFGIALPEAHLAQTFVPVTQTMTLDLGGRIVQLDAWPTSHTDNDLTVYDRQTRTLFTSDLLFAGHLPVLDGNLRGWLGTLDQLARMDVALVVPGHGPTSTAWPQALEPERRYLSALRDDVRAALKQGLTLSQTVERAPPPAVNGWLLVDRFHRRNVTAAYAELEWE